jgi:hypothetical protein
MKCSPIIIMRATQKKMMSKAGDQHVGRVIALELGRFLRPAERGERPQGGREPGVEHVLVAGQLESRLTVVFFGHLFGECLGFGNEHLAVRPYQAGI